MYFAIAEVDDGYTVIEYGEDESAEEKAIANGGTLVDPGPFQSYEEACEALDEFEYDDDRDDE